MLFNSFEFVIFFVIFLLLYFAANNNLKSQNLLLLVASYFFYGWWDWKFLSLILISSLCDYIIGKRIEDHTEKSKRKALLILSMSINLGILGFFKYFNFFSESFHDLMTNLGFSVNPFYLNVILPVGISFYTFQTMSYTIDIYKGKMRATSNLLEFMAFVSFFPQLVAGPIERASNLLPQFGIKRHVTLQDVKEGGKQALWGLFKKIVIADNCALYVNQIFDQPDAYPGSILLIGILLFAFQIYGDFSGYSDIAIGIARMLGFNLMQNFKSPYLASDIQDFWRRWHISLSTWFRDYLYIPLGGSRSKSTSRKYFNIFVTFTVSGFWHGANWTFIIWGMLHSFYYMIQVTIGKYSSKLVPENRMSRPFNILITFVAVVFAWIFFRAESVSQAYYLINQIFTASVFDNPIPYLKQLGSSTQPFIILIALLYLAIFELNNPNADFSFKINGLGNWSRVPVYVSLLLLIILFRATGGAMDFIYFQF